MNVTVIGCDGRPPGPEAAAALNAARTVVGAARHRHLVPEGTEFIELKQLSAALDAIAAGTGDVAVLASGDPGFFGIVRALRGRGITPDVIPAVSSVALAFARLGLDWDDALVLSAHGRDLRQPLAAALAHPKAAILTAPGTAAGLGRQLQDAGKTVYAAELLGTPGEKVAPLSAEPPADPSILISLDTQPPGEPRWLAGHQGAPDGWALPEDEFAHRDGVRVGAVAQVAADDGLGQHQQFVIVGQPGPRPGAGAQDTQAG